MTAISQGKGKRGTLLGLWLVLLKVGGKAVPALLKLLKGFKFGKFALAGSSLAVYSVLFSWQFALILMGSIFLHEMGHVWAMKRCGLKVRGIYFLPLLGAAAVTEDEFPSRGKEAYIALMGPLWGFGLAVVTFGVYLMTQSPMAAAIAGWMALVNLFNLLPIDPLDGGRVMKSIGYSIHSGIGYWIMVAGLVLALLLVWKMGLGLLVFIIFIGGLELLQEGDAMRRQKDLRRAAEGMIDDLGLEPGTDQENRERVVAFLKETQERFGEGVGLLRNWGRDLKTEEKNSAGDKVVCLYLRAVASCSTKLSLWNLVRGFRNREKYPVYVKPTARTCWLICFTEPEKLFESSKPTMKAGRIALTAVCYVGLAAALIAVMWACSEVPAAATAFQALLD